MSAEPFSGARQAAFLHINMHDMLNMFACAPFFGASQCRSVSLPNGAFQYIESLGAASSMVAFLSFQCILWFQITSHSEFCRILAMLRAFLQENHSAVQQGHQTQDSFFVGGEKTAVGGVAGCLSTGD
jgi:hypothetical protein